jgi:hypothetical protein
MRAQRATRSTQCVLFMHALRVAFCAMLPCTLYSQGVLPPKTSTTTAPAELDRPLLIGEKVPESFLVTDDRGNSRGLLTYKSAIDIMVVGFLSSTCPDRVARWGELERFYETYKGWHVAFVAINAGSPEIRADLSKRTARAGLPIPVLEDPNRLLTQAFKVGSVPFLVIIDESEVLRYRGPPGKDARQAIEAVIGHMVPVPNPEPLTQEECSVQ